MIDEEEINNNIVINEMGRNEHQLGEGALPVDDNGDVTDDDPGSDDADDYDQFETADSEDDADDVIENTDSEGAGDSDDIDEEEDDESNDNDDNEGAHGTPVEEGDEGVTDADNAPIGNGDVGETPAPRYNLRENRSRDYSHRFDDHQNVSMGNTEKKLPEGRDEMHKYIVGHMMTQMTANAGIKKHGDKAVEALLAEFCQLDDKSVFKPLKAESMTGQQKRDALRAIN